jgi:two-component system, NtrC family, sensor kinase
MNFWVETPAPRDAMALTRALLNADPVRTVIVDARGSFLVANEAWNRFAAQRSRLAEGDTYFDYLARHFESTERVAAVCARGLTGLAQREVARFDLDYPTVGGNLRWFRVTMQPCPELHGRYLIRHEDVTEKRLIEEKLRAALRFQQVILDHAGYAMIVTTGGGAITTFNPAAERMLGYAAGEVLNRRNLLDFHDPAELGEALGGSPSQLESMLALTQGEEGTEREWTWVRKDGTRVPVLLSVNALRADNDVLTGFVAMAVDIGARKKIEAQLSQAQRLESIGQLAAGIAHEINTPMQFVSDNVEFLETCFQTICEVSDEIDQQLNGSATNWSERRSRIDSIYTRTGFVKLRGMIQSAIGDCRDGCERIVSIVRAMRQLSHPGTAKYERIDLNELIRSACTLSRNRWKYIAELELLLDTNLPPVKCRVAEISQVMLNLVVNAADAIAEAVGDRPEAEKMGTIRVRTESTGDAVLIRVSDTGPGIPQAIRERIFDPFFTTKAVGKGTGQGLSIAYDAVVNKHQGTIQVFSEVGAGAMFVVTLPVDLPSGPLSGMWQVGGHRESERRLDLNQPSPHDADDLIG